MWCGSKGEPIVPAHASTDAAGGGGGDGGGGGGGGGKRPGASDPGSDVGPVEPLPIKGLHWLDHDALAVVAHQGLSTLLLVLDSGLHVREQVEWMDQPLSAYGSAAGGLGGSCFNSIVGLGPRLYLLGGLGLMCGRLLPWSERLKTLQDIQKFELGLFLALEFYKVMQHRLKQQGSGAAGSRGGGGGGESLLAGTSSNSSSRGASFSGPTGVLPASTSAAAGGAAAGAGGGTGGTRPRTVSLGGMARSEGWGAEPQQLEQWMLSLMLGYVHTTMQELTSSYSKTTSSSSSSSNAATAGVLVLGSAAKQLQHVAAIAVSCCLLLLRPSVLFDRVFAMFDRGPGALRAAAVGALVEALEPAVLADLLEGVSPEVMHVSVRS
jgi:hypothetical protein